MLGSDYPNLTEVQPNIMCWKILFIGVTSIMFVYLVHSIRNALDVGRKYIIANGRELGFDLVINYGRQNTVGNFPNYSHSRREIKMKQENKMSSL